MSKTVLGSIGHMSKTLKLYGPVNWPLQSLGVFRMSLVLIWHHDYVCVGSRGIHLLLLQAPIIAFAKWWRNGGRIPTKFLSAHWMQAWSSRRCKPCCQNLTCNPMMWLCLFRNLAPSPLPLRSSQTQEIASTPSTLWMAWCGPNGLLAPSRHREGIHHRGVFRSVFYR